VRLIGKSRIRGDGGQRRNTDPDAPESRVRFGLQPKPLRRYTEGAAKTARQGVRREPVMCGPNLERGYRIASQVRRQQIRPIPRSRGQFKQRIEQFFFRGGGVALRYCRDLIDVCDAAMRALRCAGEQRYIEDHGARRFNAIQVGVEGVMEHDLARTHPKAPAAAGFAIGARQYYGGIGMRVPMA